ncbi:MAG: hypothetical protein KA116_04630 [Proteobacteria bacterium]|nr:hypothetical protein [Pseudomonadota bacterium]
MGLIHSLVKAKALIKVCLPHLISIIFLSSIGKVFAFTEIHSLALFRAAIIEANENCQLALRPTAKKAFFKTKANLAQISQKTEILEFLKTSNVDEKYLEDLSERVEKLLQYRALFNNGILSNAIFSALEKQFSVNDKATLTAYLQNFSAQNSSTQNEIMASSMDYIAVTFHSIITQDPKKISPTLEIPTHELINFQSYLKLYSRDDPGLFFLELSIRFIISKQPEFFSNQWDSLFRWLRSYKGRVPYEINLKVPSKPISNTLDRVHSVKNEEFDLNAIAYLRSQDGVLNLTLSIETQSSPALGQFIYMRHGHYLNLNQLINLSQESQDYWLPDIKSHLDTLILKLQNLQRRISTLIKPEEDLSKKFADKERESFNLSQDKTNIEFLIRRLNEYLRSPESTYNNKSGEDYIEFQISLEIDAIEKEESEIDEKILELQRKMESLIPGFPSSYGDIAPEVLEHADHFFNRVEELLIEFDSQAYSDDKKVVKSGHYLPADRVFELLANYVKLNHQEISFDDFYAGISKLLSIMTSRFETRIIAKITLLIKSIIQEYPMTKAELRRVMTEVAKNLRIRLLYHYNESSLLEEYFRNENTWWNRAKRIPKNDSSESLKENTPTKKKSSTLEKRKTLEAEISKLKAKKDKKHAEAFNRYINALKDLLQNYNEQRKDIQAKEAKALEEIESIKRSLETLKKMNKTQIDLLLKEDSSASLITVPLSEIIKVK